MFYFYFIFQFILIESVINACGENVPWTDLFFHLIGEGNANFTEGYKIVEFISLFSKKAKEIGEELIDNYINGNVDYLEKFKVDIGGVAGLKNIIVFIIVFMFLFFHFSIYF